MESNESMCRTCSEIETCKKTEMCDKMAEIIEKEIIDAD